MRKIERISVRAADRERLERLVRDRNTPQKVVWRARIVLGASDGLTAEKIAAAVGKSLLTVRRWRRRYSLRCQAVARQQHDPRPPNHLLRRVSVPNQPFQSFAISRADLNLLDFPHRRRLAGSRRFVNRLSATEH